MNATRDFDALVLDYGCVISYSMFELHGLTERALGLAPGTLDFHGPFAPEGDALWRDMQAGHISERDYWHQRALQIGRLVGEEWRETQTLFRRAYALEPEATTRPEAVATIRAAKAAGLRVVVLTNELDLFNGPEFRQRLPLLDLFDVIVDATYTGILKPDPRAYAAAAEAAGAVAARCLMVDDQPRNAEGAERAGMAAQWFDVTQPAATYRRVRERLGLVHDLTAA